MSNNKKIISVLALAGFLFCFQANAVAIIDQKKVEEKFQDFKESLIDNDAQAAEVEIADSLKVEFNLPKVSLLPDSRFYFLKTWYEKIKLFFTFSKDKKINSILDASDERLAEANQLLEKGAEAGQVFQVINDYQVSAGSAIDLFNKYNQTTAAFGIVLEDMTERLIGQQEFIDKLKEKLPEDYASKVEQFSHKIQEFIQNNQVQ